MITNIIDEIKKRRCIVKDEPRMPPPDVRRWLEKYGEEKITHIAVCRKPVQSYIRTALNIISLGKFNKNLKLLNYDDIFHLYLYITVGGKQFLIEKNQVVQFMEITKKIIFDEECRLIPLKETVKETIVMRQRPINTQQLSFGSSQPRRKTIIKTIKKEIKLKDFFANAEKHAYGKFWFYHANGNNCQVFVETLLLSNGLIKFNDETHRFIKQDAAEIFRGIKYVSTFGKRLTDLAAILDQLQQGC